MIHTIKTIDYKNAKFTEKEMLDYCKKMGMKLSQSDIEKIKKVAKPEKVKK